MKTKNKPRTIVRSVMLAAWAENRNSPAQQDSGNSILEMGGTLSHRERREHKEGNLYHTDKEYIGCFRSKLGSEAMSKMQNVPAQRHSKMSNLKIETENSLPQRHSKMSILDFGGIVSAKHSKQAMFIERIKNMAGCFGRLSGLLCWPHGGRLSGVLCWPHGRKTENRSAQRDSGMSNLKADTENTLPQQYSKMSNGRLSGKTALAQRGSKISNLVLTPRPLRPLRLTDGCPVLYAGRMGNALPAQQDSGNSILGMGEQGIMTVLVKNNKPFLPLYLCDLVVNVFPQRHSKMSNLKIDTENSLPQRHSKMSNGRLSGVSCRPHGQNGIYTTQVKNIVRCFGRLSGLLCWPHGGRLSGVLCWPHGRETQTSSAQRSSKNSKLDFPLCLCDSVVNWFSAQRGSENSKLVFSSVSLNSS